jgi:deoxyadenosine/deoxycytidine kinase
MVIIRVEGNIGCGKSTLLHHLSERVSDIVVVPEPVSGWGEHLRGVYDPECANMWKLPMQMLSACTREEAFLSTMRRCRTEGPDGLSDSVIVVERSNASAGIFGSLTLDSDEKSAFDLLGGRYKEIEDSWCKDTVQASIYLRASPKTCAMRIVERSRDGECGIDSAFLRALHDAHESEFSRSADVVIDCDHDSSDAIATQVIRFIESKRRS